MEKETEILNKQKAVRTRIIQQYAAYRKEKKLSQEDLANLMGIKRPGISRFETGKYNPSLDLLVKMAECLDLEIEISLRNNTADRKRDGKR